MPILFLCIQNLHVHTTCLYVDDITSGGDYMDTIAIKEYMVTSGCYCRKNHRITSCSYFRQNHLYLNLTTSLTKPQNFVITRACDHGLKSGTRIIACITCK